MQAEQVAGLQHQRPDLVIAAHGEVELIIQRLPPVRPEHRHGQAVPFHHDPRRPRDDRPARQHVFDQHPGNRQPCRGCVTVITKAIVWPASASSPVALAGRLEVGDPRAGEEPADQHQAQQGDHRAGEQPDVEDDRDRRGRPRWPGTRASDHDPRSARRHGDRVEQLVDDRSGRHLAQPALGLEDDPVAQDRPAPAA